MTTVLKCLDTPAIGSTVSEHAGPKINRIRSTVSEHIGYMLNLREDYFLSRIFRIVISSVLQNTKMAKKRFRIH